MVFVKNKMCGIVSVSIYRFRHPKYIVGSSWEDCIHPCQTSYDNELSNKELHIAYTAP